MSMNRLLSVIYLLVFLPLGMVGQPFGNEWIDFRNTNPYLKIKITSEGLYRIDFTTLSNTLAAKGYSVGSVDPRDFQLFGRGEQLPIYVEGETDGTFDQSDFIEFYATGNDGWLDTRLFDSPGDQPNKYYSNFNDTAAYFLTWNSQPGAQHLRLQTVSNNISNPPAAEQYFIHRLSYVLKNAWHAGESKPVNGVFLYDSRFRRGEGYMGSAFNKTSQTHNIVVDKVYTGAGVPQATIRSNIVSVFQNQHRIRFQLNGSLLMDSVFSGEQVNLFTTSVSASSFNNNGTADEFRYEALGTGSSDRNHVGYIEVDYPRRFDFNNASAFKFELTGAIGSSKYLEISNFDAQGQAPILIDVANRQRIVGSLQGGLLKYRVNLFQQPKADIYLTSVPQIRQVTSMQIVTFVDYSQVVNQGDYLIVTNKSLRDDGQGNDWINQYRQYRSSASGGAHKVVVAEVDQLYDQFAYGVSKHPLGIKQFITYAMDSFAVAPVHVFLIGKSLEYGLTRTNAGNYNNNIVPTFGHPGSDMLLSTVGNDLTPRVSIGRLSARNGGQVKIYLDKVIALEANQRNTVATIEQKSWMKQVLHLAGGNNVFEQDLFNMYLRGYERIVEGATYGGEVVSYQKTSADPIQTVQSEFLDSIITNGVSLITFFGHSSTNSFDVNLDDPNNYDNFGKYPLIVSNGCFSGQIHSTGSGVSEDFIFAKDKGAIAFIASVSYGEPWSLNTFTRKFYENVADFHYRQDIGRSMMHTMRYIDDTIQANDFLVLLTQQNSLHGDPAVKLNTHDSPDYAITPAQLSFDPPQISVNLDSFTLKIVTYNIGYAVDTTISVEVVRNLPNGDKETVTKEVPAPMYIDTILFTFPTDYLRGVGVNSFDVWVESGNIIAEISENNQRASISTLLTSNAAFPVYPLAFGIEGELPIILRANTSDAMEQRGSYVLELDTSAAFSSPLKISQQVEQSGGVIEWTPDPSWWQDSTEYFWRIAAAPSPSDTPVWNMSSFLVELGSAPGWNQSHPDQLLSNDLIGMNLNRQRLEFKDELFEFQLTNGKFPTYIEDQTAKVIFNGVKIQAWSCVNEGRLVITVFDERKGDIWKTRDFQAQNYFGADLCTFDNQSTSFQFKTNTAAQRKEIIDFLQYLPDSLHVIIMSFQTPPYKSFKADSLLYGSSIWHEIRNMGGEELFYLDTLTYSPPFIFYSQVGSLDNHFSIIGNSGTDLVDTIIVLAGSVGEGVMSSPFIGPGRDWEVARWKMDAQFDPAGTDESKLDIYSINSNGTAVRSIRNLRLPDTSLTALQTSMLRLELNVLDTLDRSAPQLDYWRVTYQPYGDVSVNPAIHYVLSNDTLLEGEELKLEVALQNVTRYDMDSMKVHVYLIGPNNLPIEIYNRRYKPMQGEDTLLVTAAWSSVGHSGNYMLVVEANADEDQPEQNRYNNFLYQPILVNSDNRNPLLDVTFDGRPIMDGDIVSARPEIVVQLKDENPYLALNDTSIMEVWLTYPSGFRERIPYSDPRVEFIPADSTDLTKQNAASLILRPEFRQDGQHELMVKSRDRSGNAAGKLDYQISFEVITRDMISNVLNYPNPFTSRTQFVFTLTGSQVPDYLKIQIMTISGTVVREITKEQLGELYIGVNRSDYWWDGTDEFGDPLANGLYLYRVIASSGGENVDQFSLRSIDRYFSSGIGKMYLAR